MVVTPGAERLWVVMAAAAVGLLMLAPLRALTSGAPHHGGSIARLLLILAAVFAGLALGCGRLGLSNVVPFFELGALATLIAGLVGLLAFILFDLLLARAGMVVPPILRDLVAVATSVLITVALLRTWGFNVLGLITTSAVLTAVVGLALQTTLANVFSGLALQLDRTLV